MSVLWIPKIINEVCPILLNRLKEINELFQRPVTENVSYLASLLFIFLPDQKHLTIS